MPGSPLLLNFAAARTTVLSFWMPEHSRAMQTGKSIQNANMWIHFAFQDPNNSSQLCLGPVNGPHFPEVTEQANHIGQLKEVETYDSAIHSILVA